VTAGPNDAEKMSSYRIAAPSSDFSGLVRSGPRLVDAELCRGAESKIAEAIGRFATINLQQNTWAGNSCGTHSSSSLLPTSMQCAETAL